MKKRLSGLVASAALFSSANALVYSETDSGDLSNLFWNGTDVMSVSAGSNTISGSLSGSCIEDPTGDFADCSVGDSADFFSSFVDPSLELLGATLTISDLSFSGNLNELGIFNIYTNEGVSFLDFSLDFSTPIDGTFDVFPPEFEFNPSIMGVQIASATLTSPVEAQGVGDFSLNYVFDLTFGEISADPVPVPAALPLFLAGLGAVGVARRRKSHQ